ncbi:MAG: flagellar protein FliT [Desulfobacca sp.]|nr:flagellar protein FliT [Desulfobacca sp.]
MEKHPHTARREPQGLKTNPGVKQLRPVIEASLPALQQLSGQLWEAAARGDLEQLSDLLGQRRALLDGWRRLSGPPPTSKGALSDSGMDCQLRLKQVLAQDRKLFALLANWRETILARLTDLGRGQQLLKGYGPPENLRPRFVDRRQ